MPPLPPDLLDYVAALKTYALGFTLDSGITVPCGRLLALIDLVTAGRPHPRPTTRCPDHRISDLIDRLGRKESTIRQMCAAGEFEMPSDSESAYKYRGKEWKIPEAAVLAYEAQQRVAGSSALDNLSDWKKVKSPKPRRKRAAQT